MAHRAWGGLGSPPATMTVGLAPPPPPPAVPSSPVFQQPELPPGPQETHMVSTQHLDRKTPEATRQM